jgi:hypothetical protein
MRLSDRLSAGARDLGPWSQALGIPTPGEARGAPRSNLARCGRRRSLVEPSGSVGLAARAGRHPDIYAMSGDLLRWRRGVPMVNAWRLT